MSRRRQTATQRLLAGGDPAAAINVPADGVRCPLCRRGFFLAPGQPGRRDGPLPPALSRADNRTRICSDCGQREALRAFGIDPEQLRRELWG